MHKSNKYFIHYISNIMYNKQNIYSNSNLNVISSYRRFCNKKLFNIFDMHDLYIDTYIFVNITFLRHNRIIISVHMQCNM